jgi:hypothetical protein
VTHTYAIAAGNQNTLAVDTLFDLWRNHRAGLEWTPAVDRGRRTSSDMNASRANGDSSLGMCASTVGIDETVITHPRKDDSLGQG